MKRKLLTIAVTAAIVALSGCANQKLNTRPDEDKRLAVNDQIKQYRTQMAEDAVVNRKDDYYVEPLAMNLTETYPWLDAEVDFKLADTPFEVAVSRILKNIKADVRPVYALDMEANKKLTLEYQGTAEGALNHLARTTGFRWEMDGKSIKWTDYVTKTLDISIAPGEEKFKMGIGSSSAAQAQQAGAVQMTGGVNSAGQNITRESQGGIWADVDASIKQLLSKDGVYKVSQTSGTITVRDHAVNVENVERTIKELNHSLTKQVLLKIQLLEFSVSDGYQYGIDWAALKTSVNGNKFTLNGGMAATALSGISSTVLGVEVVDANNPWAGSKALINALGLQGGIQVMNEPELVTTNGRIAAVNIGRQTTYLASSSTTNTANVGSTAGLTPGVVEDGFNMYVLPKILDGKVVLTMTTNMANLDAIETIKSQDSSIQAPKLSKRDFMQTATLRNGETLMLSGFRQERTSDDQSSFLGIPFLGGVRGSSAKTELIMIITPIVMDNNA